ncbi:MAG: DUF2071 domain-containing protein [Chitinophagaceae bacterium]
MSWLKSHPFAIEAHFESSLVLSYCYPAEFLQQLIPPCFELDCWQKKWGFVALAMVSTEKLRPKGFPEWMGRNFILAGFRIFVRYQNRQGKKLRGLYIMESATDSRIMNFAGNLMTHYRYQHGDFKKLAGGNSLEFESKKLAFKIKANWEVENIDLPKSSPFADWSEARRFAGPLPFTFSYLEKEQKVLVVEGVRTNWSPQPVFVVQESVQMPSVLQEAPAKLANAFLVQNVPYYWKKGRLEKWANS